MQLVKERCTGVSRNLGKAAFFSSSRDFSPESIREKWPRVRSGWLFGYPSNVFTKRGENTQPVQRSLRLQLKGTSRDAGKAEGANGRTPLLRAGEI